MTIFNTFETNSATDANDLIGKLKTFLESNSFVVEDFFQEGNGQRLHVSKNGFYYNFKSFINEVPFSQATSGQQSDWKNTDAEPYNSGICMCLSTSYDNSLDYDRQPGSITDEYTGNEKPDGDWAGNPILLTDGAIVEYDFFYNGNVVYIACQFNPGYYTHLCFGEMDKIGEYDGGSFCNGSFYHYFENFSTSNTPRPALYCANILNFGEPNYVMTQVKIGEVIKKARGLIPTEDYGSTILYDLEFIRKSKNPFLGGKGTLIPEQFYIEEIYETARDMPVGTLNGLYNVYFENYTPKEIITVGTRRYVLFPYWQKTSPWNDTVLESSGMGVAIQVDNNYTV